MAENKRKKKQEEVTKIDLNKLSLQQKLFILRETIDLVSLGYPVDQKVIDNCYESLCDALTDYKWLAEERAQDFFDFDSPDDFMEPQGMYSIEEAVKKEYGESYKKLLDGLDELNQNSDNLYQVYFFPQGSNSTKLKVFDDHNGLLKRVYEDKYDLDLNLESDLKNNFENKKITFSNKKLSNNKEENRD